MKTVKGGLRFGWLWAGVGLILLPLVIQGATNKWTNAGDGDWDVAGNWSLGTAPASTDNGIMITNAGSKTVTITSSTATSTLTVSNLLIQAAGGATNRLLLSGNTSPLACVSAAAGVALTLGSSANQAGELVVDGGALVTTNANGDAFTYVGDSGTGVMTVSNGMWRGNQLYVGYNSTGNGTLNLVGGTNSFGYTADGTGGKLYIGAAGRGSVFKTGGLLVTTNAAMSLGNSASGVGTMTVSSGLWLGYSLTVGNNGQGTLNLLGGTNVIQSFSAIGSAANSTGNVSIVDGLFVATNAAGSLILQVSGGAGFITVSNAAAFIDSINQGNATTSSGTLTLANSSVRMRSLTVGYLGRHACNITGGTNIVTTGLTIGGNLNGYGTMVMTGGLLVSTNSSGNLLTKLGSSSGVGNMTVSNGTWLADTIRLGDGGAGSSNTLTIAGGLVRLSSGSYIFMPQVANGSNNTVLVTGGILDAPQLMINASAGPANVISNSGGVYQFPSVDPVVSPAVGSIVINGGTISFRDVSTVDVMGNWAGTRLTNMVFGTGSANAFRLNNATNKASGQSYTFASNLGATNYARLELVSGQTCYRGGVPTIGSGGAILFSNTTAVVSNLTLTVAGAGLTAVGSTVSNIGPCVLAENSVITLDTNSAVNIGGALSIPTNATFTLAGGIDRTAQVTLFSAASIGGSGSTANWTVTPVTHRVRVIGSSVVIAPRAPGFVVKVQ